MSATLIDGKARAARLRADVAEAVSSLASQHGFTPALAVVLVGEDPASQIYVRNKGRQTIECGMRSMEYKLDASTPEADLLELVTKLNTDPDVDGILVQLPLPSHIRSDLVLATIDPDKDVDGFHVVNVGRLSTGQDSLVPCTPHGCLMLADETLGDLGGLNAVVVGRSNIVGKPMAQLLLSRNCTVTIAHSRTRDLPAVCKGADLLVAAVGRPEMITADFIKPGACVIDVGINRVPAPEKGEGKARLVGDVQFSGAADVAGSITPVPGGVGPMTIACLLHNTIVAACRRRGVKQPML